MATKRFLLLYPDGSKAFIKASERDEMLIAGQIAHLDTFRYKYTAQPRTFHAFADLAAIRNEFAPQQQYKRHIGLCCIFEHKGKRRIEHEESPEGLAIRYMDATARNSNANTCPQV